MTEPPVPETPAGDAQPTAPPVPFEPGSRQRLGGRGCGWMAAIGCGVVLLAGLALVAAMAFNGDRILAWSLEQFERQILAEVPSEVDEAEQRALEQAFSGARERIRAGEVDPQALQSFQSIMFELAFKAPADRSAEDYSRLRAALERLADPEAVQPDVEGSGRESPGEAPQTPAEEAVRSGPRPGSGAAPQLV